MDKKLDVVTFGESMGLMVPNGKKGLGAWGDLSHSFGGAESNVAIGVARLGCRAGWFSLLGDDPIGHGIVRSIRGEGVDVSRAAYTDQAPTGLMLREEHRGLLSVYFYRKGSAASLISPEHVDPEYIRNAKILHITGIMPALSPTCYQAVREAVRIAKEAGVTVSFDPNLRLKLWSLEQARPVILELAAMADIFLPGYAELELIYGTRDQEEIAAHLSKLQGTTIVKNMENKNLLVQGTTYKALPFEQARICVDTVGAGDGFAAGLLAGIAKGSTWEEAVRIAGFTGAMSVEKHGDWESLPTWKEVSARMNALEHIER